MPSAIASASLSAWSGSIRTAQTVIHMQNGSRNTKFMEGMQEEHGIGPSGYRYTDPAAGAEH